MLSLLRSGEVGKKEGAACLRFLERLPARPELDPSAEDVHHWLEQDAIASIGMEAAGFLNYGKSRNDQVATALGWRRGRGCSSSCARPPCCREPGQVDGPYGTYPLPGYTHLQRAQPTTVAHHLQSHFEAIAEDAERLTQLYPRVNLSPMGAAAFAGTTVKVDRESTASSLGFDGLVNNSMYAVSSRGSSSRPSPAWRCSW